MAFVHAGEVFRRVENRVPETRKGKDMPALEMDSAQRPRIGVVGPFEAELGKVPYQTKWRNAVALHNPRMEDKPKNWRNERAGENTIG
jgi:hypothetical protein